MGAAEQHANGGGEIDTLGAGRRGDSVVVPVETLADVFEEIARQRLPRVSRFISRPFNLDEEVLRTVHARVGERFASLAPGQEPHLVAESRYTDRSTEQFFSIEEVIQEAAADRDPEALGLQWTGLAADGRLMNVEIEFTTEKPLDQNSSKIPNHAVTGMRLVVLGPSRPWVRETAVAVESLLAHTKLSGLYRPLLMFRSEMVNTIFAWCIGVTLFALTSELMGRMFDSGHDGLHRILAGHTLSQRFERYILEIYRPGLGLLAGMALFLLPYLLLWAGYLLANRYVASLVPRSSISLGLGKRRYADYMNVFRFVIFGIFAAVMISVLANLVTSLIS